MSINEQIEILEREIKKLPQGYISKKTINGKSYNYLQWQEQGQKQSKYLRDEETEAIAEKIKKRRALEVDYKMLKKRLSLEKSKEKVDYNFKSMIITGQPLEKITNEIISLKKRNCFTRLNEYIHHDKSGKIFILYGLRRTGKTTLMKQAIGELSESEKSKTAFLQIKPGENLGDLNADLKYLETRGYEYVFIDEVTLMEDFIEGAALFSDIFAAAGMKIVLSGTDSLGFMFAENEQLYDRCIMLHTTFISYGEFERVLGVKGVDEYIRFGGTMSLGGVNYNENSVFAKTKTANEYVDSAIAKNILHSLKCYQYGGHFRHLSELYEKDELTGAINRVVEDMNHKFTLEVLTREFQSNDLGISAGNLRRDSFFENDILDRIDKLQFTDTLRELLQIKNKDEQTVDIKDCHVAEIKEYLELLDIVVTVPVEAIPVADKMSGRNVFTQPGIRYATAEALVKSLLADKKFQNISAPDRNYILCRILNEIMGRMLEDMVLLETMLARPGKKVFKLQFQVGEFDMVVADENNITCELYEIKHSNKVIPSQYENLIDEGKCEKTEFRYGKITGKYVIYRGESIVLDNNIKYLNAEEYLKQLSRAGN